VTSLVLGGSATLPGGSIAFAIAGLGLSALTLAVARSDGLDLVTLLGRSRDALIGGVLGLTAAAVLALLAVLFLRVVAPAITGSPVEYAPLARVTAADLARHVIFLLPLGIIVPEELAFRGTLLALAGRRGNTRSAVTLSAAAFALWHGVVITMTVRQTTLGPPSPWFWPAAAIALAVVFAGGVIFALVRLRTRTIATTVLAHWMFNAVILVGLWSTKPTPFPVP
jgi:membrane protease YdiL (CAAX protease family)